MIIIVRILKVLFLIWDILYSIVFLGFLLKLYKEKKYHKQLQKECSLLGLQHFPSEYYSKFGHLSGTLNNYNVKVEFENYISNHNGGSETISDTLITLKSMVPKYFNGLELKREKPIRIPDKGIEDFSTDNFSFDHIFKTRRGTPWIAYQFKEKIELSDKFATFYLKWIFRLTDISLVIESGEQSLECRLYYGRPFSNYISLKNLGRVLNQLIDLLEFFYKTMREKNSDFFEKIKLGLSKSTEDIIIDDLKRYPIWVGDTLFGSYEQPVLNINDVTEKLIFEFAAIDILIFCEELNLYGSAYFSEKYDYIINPLFWKDNEWHDLDKFIHIIKPKKTIKIKCIPSIKGRKNLEYEYDIHTGDAIPLVEM